MGWTLLGLVVLCAFILGPAAFVQLRATRRDLQQANMRVANLEHRLARLERVAGAARDVPPPPVATAPEPKETPPQTKTPGAPEEPSVQPQPRAQQRGQVQPPPASVPPVPQTAGPSLEERLGTRWAVWVGGAALAFGGILLVRYSIDSGFFGPGVRVICGALFAVALIFSGEWLRRDEARAPLSTDAATTPAWWEQEPDWRHRPLVSAILTAAGTIAAFATVWAAHALYGFIGPALAMILLGATGLAAMVAAALHGPALAGIGVVGAFATPMLVESHDPNAWPVVLFVAVVAATSYGLARLRSWLWLALSGAAGGLVWGFLLATSGPDVAAPSLVHMLLQTALSLAFIAFLPNRRVADEDAWFDVPAHVVAGGYALLAVVALYAALGDGAFGPLWQTCVIAAAALFAACGVGAAPAMGALVGGAIVVLAALRIWPSEDAKPLIESGFEILVDWKQPRDLALYAAIAAANSFGYAVAGAWRVFIGPHLRLPLAAVAIGVANLLPLATLGIVFMRFTRGEASPGMAITAAALALLFTGAAKLFRAHPDIMESRAVQLAFGAFASGAIAALALGLVFVLQGGALTVALALAALGAAYVAHRFDVPALRWCVCGFGIVIAARFAYDPRIVGTALSVTPIFNWLLFGYGVPAACFALASRIMLRDADDTSVRVTEGCAVLFSALLVFFEIRHAMNGGDPFARTSSLIEHGLMALSAFCFSIVLMRLDARRASPVFGMASTIAGVLGLATSAVNLLVLSNPFLTGRGIEGGTFFNGLLLGYVMPGLAAFVLARQARAYDRRLLGSAAGVATILFIFAYVTLQTRRVFHEANIGFLRSASDEEFYAYSIVWLVLGLLLLGYGLWRGSKEARIASLAFIVLTVLKVFVFDLEGLDGVLRAVSFIGLGLVLIGIGLVYQKLIFARPSFAAAGEGSNVT